MAKLLIHPATRKLLDAYHREPSHALCLIGEVGAGLRTLAVQLATDLSGNEQLVTVIEPEKGLISIDRVRQLYIETRSIQQSKRCIIIDDADAMSHDAQNSLLKLLEEPVQNVHFILTTHHPTQMLKTILSRTQNIEVMAPSEKDCEALLATFDLSPTAQKQAQFLASGRPAELTRLAQDREYFTAQGAVVTDARSFLQADDYTRLTIIKKYTDRVAALRFLDMCSRLLTYSLLKQRNYGVADIMGPLEDVMKRIEANGHVRTHLLYLVTKLP